MLLCAPEMVRDTQPFPFSPIPLGWLVGLIDTLAVCPRGVFVKQRFDSTVLWHTDRLKESWACTVPTLSTTARPWMGRMALALQHHLHAYIVLSMVHLVPSLITS